MNKRIINQETFIKETALCQKLSQENKGKCSWGNCNNCGVIPLLYKLYKGEIIEDIDEIQQIKDNFLNCKS